MSSKKQRFDEPTGSFLNEITRERSSMVPNILPIAEQVQVESFFSREHFSAAKPRDSVPVSANRSGRRRGLELSPLDNLGEQNYSPS